MRLLLDKGADVRAIDSNGLTALHLVIKVSDSPKKKNPDRNPKNLLQDYQMQLMLLEQSNRNRMQLERNIQEIKPLVQLLLDRGADIAAKDKKGFTMLHSAASSGSESLVRLLLDGNADTAAKDHEGKTALHTAARRGYKAVVQVLLDGGAEIAAKDNDGWTALEHALKGDNVPTAQLLLDKEPTLAVGTSL